MWIIDILVSIIAPVMIPFFDYGLSKVNIPTTITRVDGNLSSKERLSVFYQELPTAFIANSIWGLTYKATVFEYEYTIIWIISYAFVALFSVGLLIFIHTDYNTKTFKIILKIFSKVLIITTLIRIFFF